ncbi:MAG TPA: hypothetical protein VIL53_09570 [Solirubrobacterales bacterium]
MRDYEVFVQLRRDQPYTHVGSVRAAGDKLAREAAKEVFTRRDNPIGMWVVDRRHILPSNELERELFRIGFEKEYRQPSFFSKRAMARREGQA